MQTQSNRTSDPVKLNVMIDELIKENALLREQNKLAKHHRFGSTAETRPIDQLPLINQDIDEYNHLVESEEPGIQVKSHKRKRNKRLSFDESLPSKRINLDLPQSDKTCGRCQSSLTKIDTEITRKVDYIPAKAEVIEYARFKYACKACQQVLVRAPLPKFIILKSFVSASH